jgi:hypothetical protein
MEYTAAIAELLSRHGFRRFRMTRSEVGHLVLAGHLNDRRIDVVVDSGAGKTFVELGYCRSQGLAVTDSAQPGAPAAGAESSSLSNVFMLVDARLTLDGLPVRCDGIYAIDMTHTNHKLAARGVDPICAVIGQDVLRYHQALIDYASLALFLKESPPDASCALAHPSVPIVQ